MEATVGEVAFAVLHRLVHGFYDNRLVIGPKAMVTIEGGFAVRLINKTGAASVKGTMVEAATTVDEAFSVEDADGEDPIGVVYEDGVPDGELCWVVQGGIADVLIEDGTAATRGNWVRMSDTTNGRVLATNANPILLDHWKETGHCLQTKGAGTDVLARCALHFN